MRLRRTKDPEPTPGTQILGPIPSEHRLVATKRLVVGLGYGLMVVNPGDVADDRTVALKRYIKTHFRREPKAEADRDATRSQALGVS